MKVLIDTCVIIDAMQNREPFAEDAIAIIDNVATNSIEGYITAKSVTDIYYLIHRHFHDKEKTLEVMRNITSLFAILDTKGSDCQLALASNINDYEDAVMVETAVREGMDCIVTRNIKDYAKSTIRVVSPKDLLLEID